MSNRLVLAGIGLIVAIVLAFVVISVKGANFNSDFRAVKELISEDKLDEAKNKIDEIAEKNPDAKILGKTYFGLAKSYEEKDEIVKARGIYTIILSKYQNVDNILEVQEAAGRLNMKIIFSPIVTERDVLYEVEPGDTLSKIAKKFGATVELIKTANALKSDAILARSKIKVPKATYKILIDKSQNILTLFYDDDTIVKVYRVSTGENNSTPVGTFKIVNKIKNPVWYTEGAIVPSESPDNILGSHWLGLSIKGYGIHGTIDPESVGRQATKGCVRMLNSDVEELYTIVSIGTDVTMVD